MIRKKTHHAASDTALNITPFVDIVFLLVVFFMLVCHLAATEIFEIEVPRGIAEALDADDSIDAIIVTLGQENDELIWAVGAERILFDQEDAKAPKLAAAIDRKLSAMPPDRRVVTLRVDRHIPWSQTQYLLAAVAQSEHASGVRLSASRDWFPQ